MKPPVRLVLGVGIISAWLSATGRAPAAVARYHYVPVGAGGAMALQTPAPGGAMGEQTSWFGLVREPAPPPPRTTYHLTYRHPYTGRWVTVPVGLPAGTPRIQYWTARVQYNYGSYVVEVRFLRDGSVDVVYNSGLFRAL
jgi:hypothetical protein